MNVNTKKPTNTEMEILQILWKHGSGTVKLVNEIQNRAKEVGYTTTLKIMQIMTEKELLVRDTSSRTHIYSPAVEEGETKNILLDKLMKTAFEGSAKKLVVQALGNYKASKKEIQEIRQILDEMESKKT
jgi:BlaI family penicillinase repressor